MKNLAIVPFVLFAAACTQRIDSPAQISDANIWEYKSGMRISCVTFRMDKFGNSATKAADYCGCMMEKLDQRVSHSEWQRAAYYGVIHKTPEAVKILLPHLKDLKTCRDGL